MMLLKDYITRHEEKNGEIKAQKVKSMGRFEFMKPEFLCETQ
jgi:hypothetical protein